MGVGRNFDRSSPLIFFVTVKALFPVPVGEILESLDLLVGDLPEAGLSFQVICHGLSAAFFSDP